MPININPHNIEAEQEVLGSIILENNLIRKINLSLNDFYSAKHREIFEAMTKLDIEGTPIDISTLKSRGINDVNYLSTMAFIVVSPVNAVYNADIVREDANKRKIGIICRNAMENLQTDSVDDTLSKIRGALTLIAKTRGGSIVNTTEIAKEMAEFVDRRINNKDTLSGIPTGFMDLDELTDGFQGGDLILMAARPASGKSALAMEFAENAGVPVGVISIEMGQHQIGIRHISKLSGVTLFNIRKGYLHHEGRIDKVLNACARLAELPIYYSFSSRKIIEMERAITQMIEVYGCKEIIVDYLQLAKGNEAKKREQEVSEISKFLKSMAMIHNVPVIAISALNREVEKREGKRPLLADLRESGALEYDADVVIFLHKASQENNCVVEAIVAKGRNIALGTVKLWFNGDTMTFRNFSEH